jgi:transcriptional regulator with XRE-family HTH domain
MNAKDLASAVKDSGIPHSELARRAGVSPTSMSRYLSGERSPSEQTSAKLEEALAAGPAPARRRRTSKRTQSPTTTTAATGTRRSASASKQRATKNSTTTRATTSGTSRRTGTSTAQGRVVLLTGTHEGFLIDGQNLEPVRIVTLDDIAR